jgi:hypothetical protein
MVLKNDGRLLVAYRKASAHAATEGSIVSTIGRTDGTTWTQERTLKSLRAGFDSREPCFAKLKDGSIMLSYYVRDLVQKVTPPGNVFVCRSTDDGNSWSAPAAVDPGLTHHALTSGPVCELADGRLAMPAFGRNVGELNTSSRVCFSTDKGLTWSTGVEIANGPAMGMDFIEPNIVQLFSGNLLCLMRTNDAVKYYYKSYSGDGGATWSTPTAAFLGTGAPRMMQLQSGRIVCVYRSQIPRTGQHAVLRWSLDDGNSWTADEQIVDATLLAMMYACPVETSPGQLAIVYGIEQGIGPSVPQCDIRIRLRSESEIARLS